MYKPISDYAVTGNLHSVALVGSDSSIDWCCLPAFDSPSLLAALLDARGGGRFKTAPRAGFASTQSYLGETNVVQTFFRTDTGGCVLTDFMPAGWRGEVPEHRLHSIYRRLEVLGGTVEVEVEFSPRFDYGRRPAELRATPFGVAATSGQEGCLLFGPGEFGVDARGVARATLRLGEGQQVWYVLRYGRPPEVDRPAGPAAVLEATLRFWRTWLRRCERGHCEDFGRFKEAVNRSSLALKLLTYAPTGAIVAAPSASLPEEAGGERNWDQRYCWLREASLIVRALHSVGHLSEMEAFLGWLWGVCARRGAGELQIVYGVRGDDSLPERLLDHLEGYRHSRPVRIGNAAARQRQLGAYGEVLWAAMYLSDYVGAVDAELWRLLSALCDHVCRSWQLPDRGIWEMRHADSDFVHSKLMCWVALDRGLKIAGRYGFAADTALWGRNRDELRSDIMRRGWNASRGAFVQHYGTDALDASLLRLAPTGFLSADDPKVQATVEAIRTELGHGGFLYRYRPDNGLPGEGMALPALNFWLAEVLAAQGRCEEAEAAVERTLAAASPLGLFSEQYDPITGDLAGNYPHASSHVGLINACSALAAARRARGHRGREHIWWLLPVGAAVLNDLPGGSELSGRQAAAELGEATRLLQGAFFDPREGRVDYDRMRGTALYQRYEAAAAALRQFDPRELVSRQERLAFWINVYNTLVIHGVLAAGIRESVKEVPGFFRRVRYLIGPYRFSADDIEHGVLRGNPPRGLLRARQLPPGDARRALVISPADPRVHFALVYGASSCPPVAVYGAGRIDEQLEAAGRGFLRRWGLRLDRHSRTVSLSRIFDWYRDDFGRDHGTVLRFLLPYIEDDEERRFIADNVAGLRVRYMDFDWRLNRRLA